MMAFCSASDCSEHKRAAVCSRALEEMFMFPSKADTAPLKHPDGQTQE